jgi:hypothetical protein
MKRIFTILLAAVLLTASFEAAAQRDQRWGHRHGHGYETMSRGLGVSFGYVHSAYRLADWATDNVDKVDELDGFNIGLTKDFYLVGPALALQIGLVYTYQNDSKNTENFGVRIIGDWDEHFLSIPVKLKYSLPVARDLELFIMGGPSFVGGLASKLSYRAKVGDYTAAYSYNYFSKKVKTNGKMTGEMTDWISDQLPESKYRRLDVQLGGSVGVRFLDVLEAQIGYDWGLVNKYKMETADDLRLRRQQFYISVGLRF